MVIELLLKLTAVVIAKIEWSADDLAQSHFKEITDRSMMTEGEDEIQIEEAAQEDHQAVLLTQTLIHPRLTDQEDQIDQAHILQD